MLGGALKWIGTVGLAALLMAAPVPVSAAESPFARWAAVVVAGDNKASNGAQSEAFDNARRDIVQSLTKVGFDPVNIRQFSVQPQLYPDPKPRLATPIDVGQAMVEVAQTANEGCLFYLTSHGTPQGAVLGEVLLSPRLAGQIVQAACGDRPTIAVISACFSGVFIPALAAPNRMVMTAARPDRTSFGCGVDDVYPYFDDCILSGFRTARDFMALGEQARVCVDQKERAAMLTPPSEPQTSIGGALRFVLPLLDLGL
jgi:hypothetical protein